MAVTTGANGKVVLSENGFVTPDNGVLAHIDRQPQMLFGVGNFDRQNVITKTPALAKAGLSEADPWSLGHDCFAF
jgi:hypothetical protein